MRFRVLGRLEAWAGNAEVPLGPYKQRLLLAVMICHLGESLSADHLIDLLWDGAPPRSAGSNLRGYVHGLRTILGPDLVVRSRSAYALAAARDRVDSTLFLDTVKHGEWAMNNGDSEAGRASMASALDLWRGPAYADIDEVAPLAAERDRLEAYRLLALEHRIEADLRLGSAAEIVPELTDLVKCHPYRERFWAQLMIAHYRAGQRADALATYRQLRATLADDLGIEPPPDAVALHEAILSDSPDLMRLTSSGRATARLSGRPVPAQLPPDVATFSGRTRELDALSTLAVPGGGTGPAVVTISGPGGIGKTWLALRWAHRNRARYPDGQLYVNLRGFDPSGRPVQTGTAIRSFLDALGVPFNAVPPDQDAQVGLYRSLLDGRRMLVVLDNARDTAQVAGLVPGTSTCTVLVTSRDRMTGLVSASGAVPLPIDVLSDDAARELLVSRLGVQRIAAEPEAIATLVAACSGLPLALAIAAARAAVAPDIALSTVARDLGNTDTRLGALDEGDTDASLRAVLSWSYAALPAEVRRTFALMGLAPGPDLSGSALTALTGLSRAATDNTIRAMHRQSLVMHQLPDRWRTHDLIRLYAAERAGEDVPAGEAGLALRRLVDFLVHTAHAADRLINPNRSPATPEARLPGVNPVPLADEGAALAWFAAEYTGLVAAQALAAERGWHRATWHLAWALYTFQRRTGRAGDDVTAWRAGLAAAQRLGDRRAELIARRNLGESCAGIGRHEEAVEHLGSTLTMANEQGDVEAEASGHRAFAFAYVQKGNTRSALHHAIRTLRLSRALGDPVREADALHMVGWFAATSGHHVWARPFLEAALAMARRHTDRNTEIEVIDSLGYVTFRAGQLTEARAFYQESLALTVERGYTMHEADVREHLGDVSAALGAHDRARVEWEHAIRLYDAQLRTINADRVRTRLAASS